VYLFFERLQLVLVSAWDLCVKMAAIGLLANHTHVRICPHHNIVLEAIKPDARAALRDPFMRTILPSTCGSTSWTGLGAWGKANEPPTIAYRPETIYRKT
jgi:hypothetical protein